MGSTQTKAGTLNPRVSGLRVSGFQDLQFQDFKKACAVLLQNKKDFKKGFQGLGFRFPYISPGSLKPAHLRCDAFSLSAVLRACKAEAKGCYIGIMKIGRERFIYTYIHVYIDTVGP